MSTTKRTKARPHGQPIKQSPSDYCQEVAGCSLAHVAHCTARSSHTLINWHKNYPDLFRIVVQGVGAS